MGVRDSCAYFGARRFSGCGVDVPLVVVVSLFVIPCDFLSCGVGVSLRCPYVLFVFVGSCFVFFVSISIFWAVGS